MSDPTLSDIDFKNKIVRVWTTLKANKNVKIMRLASLLRCVIWNNWLTLLDNGFRKQAALARNATYSPSFLLNRNIELNNRFLDCRAARWTLNQIIKIVFMTHKLWVIPRQFVEYHCCVNGHKLMFQPFLVEQFREFLSLVHRNQWFGHLVSVVGRILGHVLD